MYRHFETQIVTRQIYRIVISFIVVCSFSQWFVVGKSKARFDLQRDLPVTNRKEFICLQCDLVMMYINLMRKFLNPVNRRMS